MGWGLVYKKRGPERVLDGRRNDKWSAAPPHRAGHPGSKQTVQQVALFCPDGWNKGSTKVLMFPFAIPCKTKGSQSKQFNFIKNAVAYPTALLWGWKQYRRRRKGSLTFFLTAICPLTPSLSPLGRGMGWGETQAIFFVFDASQLCCGVIHYVMYPTSCWKAGKITTILRRYER